MKWISRCGVFSVCLIWAGPGFADDAEYWRAKAVSAIAIQGVVSGEKPRPVPVSVAGRGDSRPVVTMLSAAWCVPCQRAKVELKAVESSLPFVLKVVDVDQAGWPNGVDSIPHFEWE